MKRVKNTMQYNNNEINTPCDTKNDQTPYLAESYFHYPISNALLQCMALVNISASIFHQQICVNCKRIN